MSDLPVPAAPHWSPLSGTAGNAAAARPARSARADRAEVARFFRFMRDAESRFSTLRMTVLERRAVARGEVEVQSTLWLRHPGRSKLIQGQPEGPARGGYQAWLGDGEVLTHYDADANVVRSRPRLAIPVGADSATDLPAFGRLYRPLTPLPTGTVVDTFVHPHGLCRNVLWTGELRDEGVDAVAGREVRVLRCDHPRASRVLADRPDHRLVVGVDRVTGLVLLLEERIGDQVTHRAEVTSLSLDQPIGDEVFELHLPSDVRRLY